MMLNKDVLEAAKQALIKRRRFGGTLSEQTQAAIEAYEKSLAKAGLGIRPRKPTESMMKTGEKRPLGDPGIPFFDCHRNDDHVAIWQAMWDAGKPDG